MRGLLVFIRNKWGVCLLIALITLLPISCTEELTNDVQQENQFKAFHMLPEFVVGEAFIYKGMVNNDSIEIVVPAAWNGSFIVYAHGYVDPILPIKLPNDVIESMQIKQMIVSLGFGYATTSYSENGFAVKEGTQDILFLGNMLKAHFKPVKLFLGGVSEGGLVALKTLEKYGRPFDAGIVVCGPVGDFYQQLQYFGDFHVLFNYFYAQELASVPDYLGGPIDLGTPAGVSTDLMEDWNSGILETPLLWVVSQNPMKLPVLLQTANVPLDGVPIASYPVIARDILRFNIMATNDMIQRVHGIPFDNITRVYTYPGISYADSVLLNTYVMRIDGDKQAFKRIQGLYETSGSLQTPVVLLHTTGDHVTPVWHMEAYLNKVNPLQIGSSIVYLPVNRYGHCNLTIDEVQYGIGTMVGMVN